MHTKPLLIDGVTQEHWSFFLNYIRGRVTQGVESVSEETYSRSVLLGRLPSLLTLRRDRASDTLRISLAGPAESYSNEVLPKVRAMLDAQSDLTHVRDVLRCEPVLRRLLDLSVPLCIPGGWSRFEMLVRTIVGQQVTVKAATTIMGRIASRFGTQFESGDEPGVKLLFPTPQALSAGDWTGIGMPGKRAATIQNLAKCIHEGSLPFPDERQIDIEPKQVDELKRALLVLPGIGPWTVEYFALRGMRDANAWPGSDLILNRAVQGLRNESDPATSNPEQRWQPYRGYAAMLLWNHSLDESQRSVAVKAHRP